MVLRPNNSYTASNMQEQSGNPPQGGDYSYYGRSEQEYDPASGQYNDSSRGLSDTYYGAPQQQGAYPEGGYAQPYPPQQQYPAYGQEPYSQAPYGQPIPTYPPEEQSEQYSQYASSNTSYPPYSPPPGEPYGQAPNESHQSEGSAPPPVPPKPGEGQTDEERGVMGALAGGLAGGYAGHKVHHGLLGTLGGAYAGHKLEEAYKQHHNKPASPQPPPVPHGSHPAHAPPHQVMYAAVPGARGNFSASARNIAIDKDFDLIASVRAIDGSEKLSSIALNSVLTNDNGHFRWVKEGGNFAASAREVHLSPPGQGPLELRAELRTMDGRWQRSGIRLDEEIENHDGDLRLV